MPEKRTFPWYSEFFTKVKTLPIIELKGIIVSEETELGVVEGNLVSKKKVSIKSYNLKTYL